MRIPLECAHDWEFVNWDCVRSYHQCKLCGDRIALPDEDEVSQGNSKYAPPEDHQWLGGGDWTRYESQMTARDGTKHKVSLRVTDCLKTVVADFSIVGANI
jgi:hypothetical protein